MTGLKKYIFIGMLVAIVFLVIALFGQNRNASKTNNTVSPTPTVLGTTAQPTTSPLATPSATVASAEQTPIPASCSGADKAMRNETRVFMGYHVAREARNALNEISAPSSSTDVAQLEFLLGDDQDGTPRLYESAQFAYKVESYTIGTVKNAGQHEEERGTLACTLSVLETRSRQTTENEYIQETVTRYLLFSVGDGNSILLTDYRDSPQGQKYSGFN